MPKLEPAEFPSRYLDCYEAALMSIFKYMGLSEETSLMGTQAYFVLRPNSPSVSPRFNWVSDEWKRVHGLTVENLPVTDEGDLRDVIVDKLDSGVPVCLLVDIYYLPYTSHYNRLHQYHFIDIFGYDDGCYYVVCPYYRFTSWVDLAVVHASFFSPKIRDGRLIFVPELSLSDLSPARVHELVEESCRYMLGLAVPEELSDVSPENLGLAGIRTFSRLLQKLIAERNQDLLSNALALSAEMMAVGYARYWFHKLIQTYREHLLPEDAGADLQAQFTSIVHSWRAIGARFGAGAHAGNYGAMERAVSRLEQVYREENKLFNSLLGHLPGYEVGRL